MKFDLIVGFGDSWMWGDELLDPLLANVSGAHPVMIENRSYRESHCFIGQIGSHYNVPVINFGWPGSSLRSAIWTYIWWLENQCTTPSKTLVLVGHTDAWRESFYNPEHIGQGDDPLWNRCIHSAWIDCPSNINLNQHWTNFLKNYISLSDCSELHRLNYMQSLLFWNGVQKRHSGLYQFCVARPPCDTVADNFLLPGQALITLLQEQPNSQNLFKPNGHPNEKGHQIICDLLIAELNRVTISE